MKKLSFEDALANLEALVLTLENDEVPLREAMQAFEKSQALISQCDQELQQAHAQVQVLISSQTAQGLDFALEDFEAHE